METDIGNTLPILVEQIFGNLVVVLEQIRILSQLREVGIEEIQSQSMNFLDLKEDF